MPAGDVLRLGELYRSACADLMLAESHDLPRDTVAFLTALVRPGSQCGLPGTRVPVGGLVGGRVSRGAGSAPGRPGVEAGGIDVLGAVSPDRVAGGRRGPRWRRAWSARDNSIRWRQCTTIRPARPAPRAATPRWPATTSCTMPGSACLAMPGGLLFGLGSLWTLASNAIVLGTVFGHMATVPQAGNFYTFVTAHGPFELTAIVFAGAAGLRLGSGLIDTRGRSRLGSLPPRGGAVVADRRGVGDPVRPGRVFGGVRVGVRSALRRQGVHRRGERDAFGRVSPCPGPRAEGGDRWRMNGRWSRSANGRWSTCSTWVSSCFATAR